MEISHLIAEYLLLRNWRNTLHYYFYFAEEDHLYYLFFLATKPFATFQKSSETTYDF